MKRKWTHLGIGPALGLGSVVIWLAAAILGSWLAPHDPNTQHLSRRLLPPAWFDGGDTLYLLGTDQLGRDILSRLLYGARISLFIGLTVVSIACTIGTVAGIVAGYYGRWVDSAVMRVVDVFLAFPFLLLALALLATLGPSLANVIIVLGVTGWVPYARTVRAEALTLRNREFVLAARCVGVSNVRIMATHIFPNLLAPIIVLATLEIATAVLAEASLTFLGLGIPPSTPTWGQMLEAGREYLFNAWWLSTLPGITLFIVVLGVSLLGDWLRDTLDPRLRRG